jgi:hypothetical protein
VRGLALVVACSALLPLATSSDAAAGINRGDDSIENNDLRGDLYPALKGLADGASIKQTFERAMSGDTSTVPALLALLSHSDMQVADWAARMLGRFGSPDVSQALKAVANDSSARVLVRAGALRGLFRMGDPSTASIARAGLQDLDYWIQIASLATLEGLGDSANSAAVVAFLDSPTRQVHPSAIFDTLEVLGDARGSTVVVDRLAREVNDKSKLMDVRADAALALEKLGRPDLGGRVLDRVNVGAAFETIGVAQFKVKRLATQQGVTISGQGQLDALLSAIDIDGKKPVLDPWARLLRGVFVSPRIFNVVSDGPDKTPNTADDVSTAESFASYSSRMYADLFGPPILPSP